MLNKAYDKLNNLKNLSVVLQYSPKINMERLIKTMQPKLIIADGSNYKSDVNRWEIICNKQKTPFYLILEVNRLEILYQLYQFHQ
mgnify:CR=1 FL=1